MSSIPSFCERRPLLQAECGGVISLNWCHTGWHVRLGPCWLVACGGTSKTAFLHASHNASVRSTASAPGQEKPATDALDNDYRALAWGYCWAPGFPLLAPAFQGVWESRCGSTLRNLLRVDPTGEGPQPSSRCLGCLQAAPQAWAFLSVRLFPEPPTSGKTPCTPHNAALQQCVYVSQFPRAW